MTLSIIEGCSRSEHPEHFDLLSIIICRRIYFQEHNAVDTPLPTNLLAAQEIL